MKKTKVQVEAWGLPVKKKIEQMGGKKRKAEKRTQDSQDKTMNTRIIRMINDNIFPLLISLRESYYKNHIAQQCSDKYQRLNHFCKNTKM